MSANYFQRDSHTAAYVFGQTTDTLFENQPRFPFEFYISFNLNSSETATDYINSFFFAGANVVSPLCKTIEMPSMKIETTPLNQYNRKRLSQTKIAFEPIKVVFHDVCDGKTLAFWDMYYRYYFADGNEPGKNQAKDVPQDGINNTNLAQPNVSATNTDGDKSTIQNIVSDKLDNHNFGFNLPTVQNTRNLIQSIEIYQVHGGKFNQVTLVNPRISAFTHDTLNYAAGDKTLEVSFTFEYEYAYYTIQNLTIGDESPNNDSSSDFFSNGDFAESANIAFTQSKQSKSGIFQSNNPSISGYESQLYNSVNNVQSNISLVVNQYLPRHSSISTSSISGLINLGPVPNFSAVIPVINTRSFASTAAISTTMYQDVNRIGNLF